MVSHESAAVYLNGIWLSRRYDGSRHECVRRCERRPIREAQVRPHVTQVKPPVVGLTPALRCDLFSCSLLTRSDSNCSTEVLHSARHDDMPWTDDSRSCGSMLHALRLDFSTSLCLFRCPPWERVPCSKLTVEHLLRQPVIFHADDMSGASIHCGSKNAPSPNYMTVVSIIVDRFLQYLAYSVLS